MTLLELLVQELPKRGGWPQWAAAAVQDSCNVIKFNSRYNTLTMNEFGNWESKRDAFDDYGWTGTNLHVDDLATDHVTKIVTREEYDQAVKLTRFEKSVKAANELARVMLENMVRQLTDATSVQSDDVNDAVDTMVFHFPAGYHVPKGYDVKSTTISEEPSEPSEYLVAAHGKVFTVTPHLTPLQRIEQLRKTRDEVVRAYSDAFVSGEAELRKLKLGDKVMFRADKNPSTLVETKIEGDIHGVTGRKWVFRDDRTGESRHILTPVNPISFQFVKL